MASDAGNPQKKKPTVAELPNTTVARVIKKALPEGTLLAKDARVAFTRAASTWVLYLTNAANEFAKANQKNRKTPTISSHDVLAAVEELEFKEFLDPLQSFLSEYQEGGKKAKKKEKRKPAPTESSSSSSSSADAAKKKQKTNSGASKPSASAAAASSSSSSSSSSKPSVPSNGTKESESTKDSSAPRTSSSSTDGNDTVMEPSEESSPSSVAPEQASQPKASDNSETTMDESS